MPTLVIVPLTARRATVYDVKKIESGLFKVLKNTAEDFKKDFLGVSGTWSAKPNYKRRIGWRGGDGYGSLTTDNEIMRYLEYGTSKRWAVMDKRFSPKTRIRSLRSGAGAYPNPRYKGMAQMLAAGYTGPKPGIAAREWGEAVKIKRMHEFWKNVQSAIGQYATYK